MAANGPGADDGPFGAAGRGHFSLSPLSLLDLLLFLVPRDVERAKAGPCLYNRSIGQRCDRWTRFNGRVDSAVDGGYSVDHFVKFKCFFFYFFFIFFLFFFTD